MPVDPLSLLIGGGSAGAGIVGDILGSRAQNKALDQAKQSTKVYSQAGIDAVLNLLGQMQGKSAPFSAIAPDLLQQALGIAFRGGKTRTGSQAPNIAQLLASKGGPGQPGQNPQIDLGTQLDLGLQAPDPLQSKVSGAAAIPSKLSLGIFGEHNNDKEAATRGIDEVTRWSENILIPAVKAGKVSPDQAYQMFMEQWNGWQQAMSTGGVDQVTRERSVADQSKWFANKLNPQWWTTLAGGGGAPPAPTQQASSGQATPPGLSAMGNMPPGLGQMLQNRMGGGGY